VGNDGANRIIPSWEFCLPLDCCSRLPCPDGAESKGRLLGLNKHEKRTPEQIRPCQGGYRLLWGMEQEAVGLAAQSLQACLR